MINRRHLFSLFGGLAALPLVPRSLQSQAVAPAFELEAEIARDLGGYLIPIELDDAIRQHIIEMSPIVGLRNERSERDEIDLYQSPQDKLVAMG